MVPSNLILWLHGMMDLPSCGRVDTAFDVSHVFIQKYHHKTSCQLFMSSPLIPTAVILSAICQTCGELVVEINDYSPYFIFFSSLLFRFSCIIGNCGSMRNFSMRNQLTANRQLLPIWCGLDCYLGHFRVIDLYNALIVHTLLKFDRGCCE